MSGSVRPVSAILGVAALATLLLAPSGSGAAGAHRSGAALTRALASSKRSAHVVFLGGRVTSPYRPCRANRTVRFFHRIGGRSLLLALSLGSDLKTFSRRPHRTSPQGKVAIVAKVGNPRPGAYYMAVLPKTLPNGATCLGARSGLRRPQVFNP